MNGLIDMSFTSVFYIILKVLSQIKIRQLFYWKQYMTSDTIVKKIIKQSIKRETELQQKIELMHRQSNDRESPTSSTHKTNTNFSILQTRHNQQTSSYHCSQYVSIEKTPKNGIIAAVSFTAHNPITQNSQQQFPFNIKKQQSVYEQYLKSLQSEIASRERQRLQLQRGMDDLQREYKILWDQLAEEKRKASDLRVKVDMLENIIRENDQKNNALSNDKQVIMKQYHYELQKNKILQANEMKLRSSYETLQKMYESLQLQQQKRKQQFNLKSQTQTQTIDKLQQQFTTLKFTSSQLEQKVKSLQMSSKNYKDETDEALSQKNKIIESLTREKGFIEKQYHKEQKEHSQMKVIAAQREQMSRQLGKKVTELEQLHELEKDKLNYRISELTFQNSTLIKQNDSVKSQLKKQLQFATNENAQLKLALSQFQKQKKVDLVHNEQLHKGLDRLQKEINTLVESKMNAEKQKEAMRLELQKQLINVSGKYEQLEQSHHEKCSALGQLKDQLIRVGREFESYKVQTAGHIEDLNQQLQSLKTSITQQSSCSSEEISKLIRQKECLLEEMSQRSQRQQTQKKEQLAQLTKQSDAQLNEIEKNHQEQISQLTQTINLLNSQITQLTHELLSSNQTHINQINRLTVKYEEKLSHLTLLQQGSSQQLEQHYNQQLSHQAKTLKSLTQSINSQQSIIQSLQKQLSSTINQYHQLQTQSKTQLNLLNTQLTQTKLFTQKLQQQSQLFKQTHRQQQSILNTQNYKIINENTKLDNQLNQLNNQLNQLNLSLQQVLHSIPTQYQPKQYINTSIKEDSELQSLAMVSRIKNFMFSLIQSNTVLVSQLQSSQQMNSELLAQNKHSSKVLQDRFAELNHKLQQKTTQTKQLEQILKQVIWQICSVVEFAQKYSGESMKKTQNDFGLLSTDSDRNNLETKPKDIVATVKGYCESLNTFIGQRLYVISIFMQESAQIKEQLNSKIFQNSSLQQKLAQQQDKYQHLTNEHSLRSKQLQQLHQKLQSTNHQNTLSISILKQHIASYKGQLTQYETQIQQISHKFQQHQRKQINSTAQITILEQELQQAKVQLQTKHKQFQNQCKEILTLTNQIQHLNELLINKGKQLNETKQSIDKINHQHILQIESLKITHIQQLQLLQNSTLNQKKTLKHSTQSTITKLQHQSLSHLQKIRQLQKIIQTKTFQYTQLQNHFSQTLKNQQSTHQTQLTSLQNQIKYLQNKSHSPSKQIMRNKIHKLQKHTQQLDKEIKILSDNNTLLRKNYLSALSEKQTLRDQIKLNKSQKSDSRTNSQDPSRNLSKELKNKYLLKKNNQCRNSNQIKQTLSQSLGPRSCSNLNLHSSQSKRFQSPRDSSTKMSSHNMTQNNNINIQPHAQTERPVSNIQRSAPQIPLDLKRIRQRNQKYFASQDTELKKQGPSLIQSKKIDMKPELLNEDDLPSLVSPVKFLDEPDHSY